ncbi:P-loop NTPase fold protein [Pseudoxanthomonas mexicana]|uniref:P-loop NTPase fold protein n=1 Tax=Pseudoxanthomonas mexicana TaxID=128785 RepID=UPI0024E242EA|nr:P-loop NTPase fold protein [Pseudoxanthomonas mexicana]
MKDDSDQLGNLSSVDTALIEYFNERSPFVSMMIEGEWGSGKTHFIRTRGSRLASRAGKKCVFFSAAGLENRSDLERSLFFAAAPMLNSGYAEALGIFTRAAMRWAKIEPNDLKFKADVPPDKVVVFIDDIERFAGDQKVILGFVIDLVDNNGLHVVVIASEKRLLKAANYLGEWKEKVVGRTVRLIPTPEEMVDVALNELSSRGAADRMEPLKGELISIVNKSGIKSFRAVKHSVREIAKVIDAIGNSYESIDPVKSILVEGLLIGLLEIKRDASITHDVADLFSHSSLRTAYEAMIMQAPDEDVVGVDKSFAEIIFDRYEGTGIIDFPGGKAFSSYFSDGILDSDGMLKLLQEVKFAMQDVEQIEAVEDKSILKSSAFEFSQEDFSKQFDSLLVRLTDAEFRSVGAIVRIYTSMKYWAQRRIISLSSGDVASLCVSAIEGIPPGELLDPNADTDIFWFQKQMDDSDKSVADAVQLKVLESIEVDLKRRRADVRSWLKNGRDDDRDLKKEWLLSALFVDEPASWIEALRASVSSKLQEVVKLVHARGRVAGVGSNLRSELPLLKIIAEGIEDRIPPSGNLSLVQSQLVELAAALRSLAENIGSFLEMERQFSDNEPEV